MAKDKKFTGDTSLGTTMDSRAAVLATALGGAIFPMLDQLSASKQDWEGGKFAVMFKLASTMTDEQIDALPDPKADTGNNPAIYKVRVTKDGKEKVEEHYFYDRFTLALPGIIAKQQRIEMLARSMKDPAKFNMSDIPQDIKDMEPSYRRAEISRLNGEIANAKVAVNGAFELFWQFKRFENLQGVTAQILYALGPDGKLLNGEDGRAFKVENTRTPIVISTKVESRKAIDTVQVGIGTFLKYDVAKAIEGKGTYQALMDTVAKGTKSKDDGAASNSRNVNTVETAMTVANDFAEYLQRIQDAKTKADWEALHKAAHGAGSDDFFLNLCWIKASLDLLVGSPKDQGRFQSLINELDKAA